MSLEDAIEVLEDDVSLLAKRMTDLVRAHNNRGKDISALKQSNDEILMVLGDLYKQREKSDPGEAIHHIITDLETLKREHAALDSAVARRLQEGWASVQRQVEANTNQGGELQQALTEQKHQFAARLERLAETVDSLTPRLATLTERMHVLTERPDLQPRLAALAAELRALVATTQAETVVTLRQELLATFQEELLATLHARIDENPALVTQDQLKMLRAETIDHAQFHELVAPFVTVAHFDKVTTEMYRTFALREQCESRHREQEVADAEAIVEAARGVAAEAAVEATQAAVQAATEAAQAAAATVAQESTAAVLATVDAKLRELSQDLLQTQLPGLAAQAALEATTGLVTEGAHAQQLQSLQEATMEHSRTVARDVVQETLGGTLEDAIGHVLQQRVQPLLDAQYTMLNEQLTTLAHTIPLTDKLHETIGESVRAGVCAELRDELGRELQQTLGERLDTLRRSLPNREVLALVQEECAMLRDSQHAFEGRFDALASRLRDHFCQELAGQRVSASPVTPPAQAASPVTPPAQAAVIGEETTLVLECVALPSPDDEAPLVEVRMTFPTEEMASPGGVVEVPTTAGPTTAELLVLLQNLQSRVEQLEQEKEAMVVPLPDPLATRVFPVGASRIQYMKLGEFRFLLSPGFSLPEERLELMLDGIEPPEEEMVATAGHGYTSTLDTTGRLVFQHKDPGTEKKIGSERVVRRFMFWW